MADETKLPSEARRTIIVGSRARAKSTMSLITLAAEVMAA